MKKLLICILCLVGCATAPPPAAVAAEAAYTAALLACVNDYNDAVQIQLCRTGVDERFGVNGQGKPLE